MIRPLRQQHHRMFTVLGVVLPVALVAGIAARKPVPMAGAIPGRIFASRQNVGIIQWSRADLFAKAPVHVALVRDNTEEIRQALALSPAKDFVRPDLLVYWVAGNTTVSDTIPNNAVLLGSFDSVAPLPFPRGASQVQGALILYSLADHEVVDVSKPISF